MKLGQLIQLRPAASVEELSDEALAAACATGDRAAQGLLFERHADAVYRFISRMRMSDANAVDDLVQATFLAAFKSAHMFKGPRLQSWLYGIASNVLRTYVRKEVARKRVATSLAEQPAVESIAPRDADVARLRQAIVHFFQKDAVIEELLVPWDRQALRAEIFEEAEVLEEKHDETGTRFRLRAHPHALERLRARLG